MGIELWSDFLGLEGAIENNLDLELQRYGVRMTSTDVLRAEGGGLLRGIPLSVNEAPAGVGGGLADPRHADLRACERGDRRVEAGCAGAGDRDRRAARAPGRLVPVRAVRR